MTRTALIAGEGRLASAIAAALDAPLVYALDHLQPQVPARPFRLERLVPFLDELLDQGVTQVVFAGAIRRPRIEPELFDPRTMSIVPRILMGMQSGDDAALRAVLEGRVFALLSCFGTPNNQAILPMVVESGVPYVAPLSGASSLRKNVRNIFHVRASYTDEIVRLVRFPGWQGTQAGEREVKKALRKALFKYKLHADEELFEKAYSYIRQYY